VASTVTNSHVLRVYYDGLCPLCLSEIRHLRRLDLQGNLDLQDINSGDFQTRFPHIDKIAADRVLHGELRDGTLVKGLDVTCMAWQLVGKGHWFAFLRWPLIRPFADFGYRFFARHRHRISGWFGRAPICEDDRCSK
tara:strand:+ start:269 stop:679 length:411 start_codon:yes stop_codon:yes gene_type:complete